MYKVFFNDQIVFLTDDMDHLYIDKKIMFYTYSSFENLKSYMEKFQNNPTIRQVYMYHEDIAHLEAEFKSLFEYCETAGGLVFNNEDNILFIKRFGKWDLPKGKIEKGEKIEEAAKREVHEECGISNLVIKNSLCSTYHVYIKNEITYLKKNHWFTMFYDGNEELTPQLDEGVEFAKWFDKYDINAITENTYPSIIDILKLSNIIKKKRKIRFG